MILPPYLIVKNIIVLIENYFASYFIVNRECDIHAPEEIEVIIEKEKSEKREETRKNNHQVATFETSLLLILKTEKREDIAS